MLYTRHPRLGACYTNRSTDTSICSSPGLTGTLPATLQFAPNLIVGSADPGKLDFAHAMRSINKWRKFRSSRLMTWYGTGMFGNVDCLLDIYALPYAVLGSTTRNRYIVVYSLFHDLLLARYLSHTYVTRAVSMPSFLRHTVCLLNYSAYGSLHSKLTCARACYIFTDFLFANTASTVDEYSSDTEPLLTIKSFTTTLGHHKPQSRLGHHHSIPHRISSSAQTEDYNIVVYELQS